MRTMLRLNTLAAALAAAGLAFGAAAQMPAPSNNAAASPNSPGAMDTQAGGNAAATTSSSKSANAKLSHADRKFIDEAAKGGMAEVALGKVVQQRAASKDVKSFASKMVDDHSKANEELRQLAQEKGVTLPADTKLMEKHEANKLAKLEGKKLDQEYMKHMVSDHKKDVKAFQNEAQKAKDPDVKAFAERTLPTLKQHLQLAQNTEAMTNGRGTAATSKR